MSCGACASVCPKKCISYRFGGAADEPYAHADEATCIDCGKCLKVCPVRNSEIATASPPFTGRYKKVLATYSKNNDLRRSAASGGFITTFICYMLEKGYADAALVSKRNGVTGKAFIAKSPEEVIGAKTSIYAPVDYANGISELLSTTCRKVIVVGLPCHIQAISNLRKINKDVAAKILLTISIVCGKTPTADAYRYIARKGGFDYDTITSVQNRGDGWPGYMTIGHGEGEYKVSYKSEMSMGMVLSSPFMCNTGCLSCVDGVGVSADLSVCDAWLPRYTKQNSDGWNLVLLKSESAMQYMGHDEIDHYLYCEECSIDDFIKANRRVVEKAKTGNKIRLKENRVALGEDAIGLKKNMYVWIIKSIKRLKMFSSKEKIGRLTLIFGKALNKLKG